MQSADRPLHVQAHRPLLPPNPPQGLDLKKILSTDEKYNSSRQEIHKIIDNSFNSAEKYLEKFWPLGRIFEYSLKWDFVNKYKKRVRKVEVIRNDLRRMK
jgi:hypothetical protein